MASQIFGVTGNRRLRRNQKADLNARLAQLPSILAAEQAAEQQRREEEFRITQLAQEKKIAKDELKFKRQEAKRGFGLEMAKTGINLGTSDFFQGMTLGGLWDEASNIFGSKSATKITEPALRKAAGIGTGGGGFFSGINLGSIAAGGLGGFGIGKMFGDMGTSKKLLYGGLAGAGLGLLSGGLSGALGGGLGGLFGGLMS